MKLKFRRTVKIPKEDVLEILNVKKLIRPGNCENDVFYNDVMRKKCLLRLLFLLNFPV